MIDLLSIQHKWVKINQAQDGRRFDIQQTLSLNICSLYNQFIKLNGTSTGAMTVPSLSIKCQKGGSGSMPGNSPTPFPEIVFHSLAYEVTQPMKTNHSIFQGNFHLLRWPTFCLWSMFLPRMLLPFEIDQIQPTDRASLFSLCYGSLLSSSQCEAKTLTQWPISGALTRPGT